MRTKIKHRGESMRVDLLCSWGGHLQEMLDLRGAWGRYDYRFITFESERTAAMNEPMVLITPPWISIPRFLRSLLRALRCVLFDRPDVLISTGMGYVDVFVFPLCKLLGTYTVYIESGANVDYVSGTAGIVRRFADRFIVRWEDLAEDIGAEFHGGIF
ncbi:MAG: UDP-N-acetylglucosamine transferase subunit ALG14 [Candidatus Methanomethylophilus sp.]|jgi:UDP-N-acetylglucosamine:LPS N-acetylglucosamine transferase|nr:UDP-N-acetylglucosamine transferase subunit ALG14 [Methanomethylophilus sp.]MCI2074754.1 UDP-N-acetylglucosamine transferase subunit ALG14 [Methanomethylophilus sp.]MCI2092326.1 UDP-N-acetylglucosamine transferase subunit ALG14 [Methanomethylophilus sp.]